MIMEEMSGLVQKKGKGDTKDCFIFDSWFDSNRSSEYEKDIGNNFIDLVKTNNEGFVNTPSIIL